MAPKSRESQPRIPIDYSKVNLQEFLEVPAQQQILHRAIHPKSSGQLVGVFDVIAASGLGDTLARKAVFDYLSHCAMEYFHECEENGSRIIPLRENIVVFLGKKENLAQLRRFHDLSRFLRFLPFSKRNSNACSGLRLLVDDVPVDLDAAHVDEWILGLIDTQNEMRDYRCVVSDKAMKWIQATALLERHNTFKVPSLVASTRGKRWYKVEFVNQDIVAPERIPITFDYLKWWRKQFAEIEQLSDKATRGYALEWFLLALAYVQGADECYPPSRSETLSQYDGFIELRYETFIIEAKWLSRPVGRPDLRQLMDAVNGPGKQLIGLAVSISGFNSNIAKVLKIDWRNTPIISVSGNELRDVLAGTETLPAMIRRKSRDLRHGSPHSHE